MLFKWLFCRQIDCIAEFRIGKACHWLPNPDSEIDKTGERKFTRFSSVLDPDPDPHTVDPH